MTISTPGAIASRTFAFRPASYEDAAMAADLDTALVPDEPMDPALYAHWWRSADADEDWIRERLVIERGGQAVGFASREHPKWEKLPSRHDRIWGDLFPHGRTREALTEVYDVLEARSKDDGSRIFVTWAREDDTTKQELVIARGYREERRGRGWELDLVRHRARLLAMLERSRERMRAAGIRILTIADDADPEKYRKLWRMCEEASQDVPRTIPRVPEPFHVFMKWFENPGIREDRFFVAREGDDIVGTSVLLFPPGRGNVWTDWTGTARKVRGRGVARALKLETVGHAIGLGVKRVRTSNDGKNAPILHLNEDMGYEPIPDWISFMRDA